MKRLLTLLFSLFLAGGSILAQDTLMPQHRRDLPPSPLKFKRYHVATVELLGLGLNAATIPHAGRHPHRQVWPAWFTGSYELGLSQKCSAVIGGSVRYEHLKYSDFPASYNFIDSRLLGFKAMLGLRCYLGKGYGEGFFLQPTAKLVWNRFDNYSSIYQGLETFRDYMVSVRFGWQKRLWRHLTLTASVGPGVGMRNDDWSLRMETRLNWYTYMSEIDYTDLPIAERINWTNYSVYFFGDSQLAIGWYF